MKLKLTDADRQHPIAIAVLPLKAEAVVRAMQFAQRLVAKTQDELQANGWIANKVAPYPDSRSTLPIYTAAYQKYKFVELITAWDNPTHGMHEDYTVHMDTEGLRRLYRETREDAEYQYDLYVAKLIKKIGSVTSAVLEGNHVWSYSVLHVTKSQPNLVTELWKTRAIINQSKLGKVFNQFPTRKVKYV